MTLTGVMAAILRYFSEFGKLPGALRKSSRSVSHLVMSSCFTCPWEECEVLRSWCLYVCLWVCLSALAYLVNHTSKLHTKFSVHVIYVHASV